MSAEPKPRFFGAQGEREFYSHPPQAEGTRERSEQSANYRSIGV